MTEDGIRTIRNFVKESTVLKVTGIAIALFALLGLVHSLADQRPQRF